MWRSSRWWQGLFDDCEPALAQRLWFFKEGVSIALSSQAFRNGVSSHCMHSVGKKLRVTLGNLPWS